MVPFLSAFSPCAFSRVYEAVCCPVADCLFWFLFFFCVLNVMFSEFFGGRLDAHTVSFILCSLKLRKSCGGSESVSFGLIYFFENWSFWWSFRSVFVWDFMKWNAGCFILEQKLKILECPSPFVLRPPRLRVMIAIFNLNNVEHVYTPTFEMMCVSHFPSPCVCKDCVPSCLSCCV